MRLLYPRNQWTMWHQANIGGCVTPVIKVAVVIVEIVVIIRVIIFIVIQVFIVVVLIVPVGARSRARGAPRLALLLVPSWANGP